MRYFLLSLFALGMSVASFAEKKAEKPLTNEWWAGPARVFGGAGFNFTQGDGSNAIKLKGWYWNARTGYQFINRSDIFATAEGDWNGGHLKKEDAALATDYRGYMHTFGAKGRVGYMWGMGNQDLFGVAPYLGIGYGGGRISVRGASTAAGRYEYRFWYVPVGLYMDFMISKDLSIGLFGEAQFAFGYRFWESTSGTVSGKNKVNWKVELPVTWQLTKTWDLQLTPFWKYYHLNPKGTTTYFTTTHDHSDEVGALLELGVRF